MWAPPSRTPLNLTVPHGRILVAAALLAAPHRGISQDKLPLYLGFFQFVHNARRRGKALLSALITALVV